MKLIEFKPRHFTLYHAGKEIGGCGWVGGDKHYSGFVGAVYFEAPRRGIALATLLALARSRKKLGKLA